MTQLAFHPLVNWQTLVLTPDALLAYVQSCGDDRDVRVLDLGAGNDTEADGSGPEGAEDAG